MPRSSDPLDQSNGLPERAAPLIVVHNPRWGAGWQWGSAVMAVIFPTHSAMGPVIYLALVGGGLVAAAAISFVLRGVKLI
jgi:hypothetical protein